MNVTRLSSLAFLLISLLILQSCNTNPSKAVFQPDLQFATRPPIANQTVDELIGLLSNDAYRVREEATTKLIAMGETIVPMLCARLKEKNLSPETAARISIVIRGIGTLDLGNKITMELGLIPAGTFTMGSPKHEKDRYDNEGPQHEVTITTPFYMGIYTVTQEQYEQIMGKNPSWGVKGAQNPVEQVTWNDAAEFCIKVSQKTNRTVRLPTEAQWEYACRAGSKTRFCYGDDNDYSTIGDYAWHVDNSDAKTHPVGQKKPNAFGLYDMSGNVWQWCADWYGPYEDKTQTDPTGPDFGEGRAVRGGRWRNIPRECRSAFRYFDGPGNCADHLGFRVVVDVK